MSKKRIAIDINDVVRDYSKQFLNVYTKFINPNFELGENGIDDFDFINVFPFINRNGIADAQLLNKFKYEDYAFEIYGRAATTSASLPSMLNLWLQNTMRNFDEEIVPDIMFVSPFEYGVSIQATLSFLSRIGIRAREYYFPVDSMTIWDKCDILITANPNLLNNMPDGKISFKIETDYNKEAKSTYSFKSFDDLICDENNTIVNLIE